VNELKIQEIELEYKEKAKARRKINLSFAEKGVVFFDLDQAQIDEGVRIGQGTTIGPGTIITGDTVIGENCKIGQSCRIENCKIEDGADIDHSVLLESSVGLETRVGPFAYIRPGSKIGNRCRIGDFVEIKNSTIGDETKVSHLSYIGDADLGAGINVGCGVVFVNFDGREKHRASIGEGAFIGCNVNLISPVSVGAGAYVAAGGTVTRNVPPGALFVARQRGRIIEGWVSRRRI